MVKRKAKAKGASILPSDEAGFVAFLEANPNDTTARAAYADWLDEHNRPLEAAEQRDAAGLSEVQCKLRRKSDGLFSEGSEKGYSWSPKGKVWRQVSELRAHLAAVWSGNETYGAKDNTGTPWEDLEVVIVEVRSMTLACLTVTFRKHGQGYGVPLVTIAKPTGSGSA
jgi:uncharacterized protein (TIGR02996 family)